jgi:uncharacterized protein (TIRG00374 family)
MKRIVEFALSIVIAALILFALSKHFNSRWTAEAVRKMHTGPLIIGVTLMMAADLLHGWRWRIWQWSLSYWNSLRVVQIGFMGNNSLPVRLGEILRAHCVAAKAKNDWGRTAALSSVAAERILDGLLLGAFGLVAISIVRLDSRLQWGLFLVSLIFASLTIALVLSVRHQGRIRRLVSGASRRFPGRMTAFARDKASLLLDGIVPLGTPQPMLAAITTTVVIWGLEGAVCHVVWLALWDDMRIHTALLFFVAVNFATLVPLTMGGIGTVGAAEPIYLISSGDSPYVALAMVLLQHAGRYLFTTLMGAAFYLGGGGQRRSASNAW